MAVARRVDCRSCGPTVAAVPWARHASAFTRAFEDLVVHDAIIGNKQAAARRYGISWRAVNNMCIRLATEALGRVDLLEGVVAVAIDEVKYKKGHRYLTVVCDHVTGRVIWAARAAPRPPSARSSITRRPGQPARVRDRGWGDLDHRGSEPANVPGLPSERGTPRHPRAATDPGPASARCLARLRHPLEARPVREAGPHHPHLPGLDRGHPMAAHQRHQRVQQRLHRPHPHGRPRFPRPQAFITMVMLDRAGIAPHLPWQNT